MLHGGAVEALLERVREVLEHDHRLGARIHELVLEFTSGVQRVDVDPTYPARRIAAIATRYCGTLGIITATRAPR